MSDDGLPAGATVQSTWTPPAGATLVSQSGNTTTWRFAAGGVYRSLDGGATWTAIFDGADSLAIGALALDAANGRLYVGTGEPNGAVDCFSGVGVYRIDNVNTNPTLIGPINPVRNYDDGLGDPQSVPAFNGATIGKILIVPDDPTTIFVATSFGGVIGIGADSAFGGTIPNHGMAGLYRLASIFVNASRAETACLAVAEAAASGLPVVAMSAPALAEVVHHGVSGYLVAGDDEAEMSERLAELLARPEQARGMGEAGRTRMTQTHDFAATLSAHAELYAALVRPAGQIGTPIAWDQREIGARAGSQK